MSDSLLDPTEDAFIVGMLVFIVGIFIFIFGYGFGESKICKWLGIVVMALPLLKLVTHFLVM